MQTDELHHHHYSPADNAGKAFIVSIILNLTYVTVEFGYGLYSGSLALISDAGHNLGDVASLALGLLALKLSKIKPNQTYTYGYSKGSILISLINAVILLITVGVIGYEAIDRFQNPHELNGKTISLVAGLGFIINGISAFMFIKNKERDINHRGAFIHLAADAAVSLSVVVAGVIITYTGWIIIDPILSLIVMVVIVISTWKILTQSLKLSLDAVPENIDVKKLIQTVKSQNGILEFYHIHIWPLSTTKNALTGHLILNSNLSQKEAENLKFQTKQLLKHFNIHHATLETEFSTL